MMRCSSSAHRQFECDALDWYLGNQSREEIDEATVRHWGEWWENPKNRAEYDEILQLHQQMMALPRRARASDHELHEDLKKMGAQPTARSMFETVAKRLRARPRLFVQRNHLAVAATCAVLLACVVGSLALRRVWPLNPGRAFATAPGEQREFTLEDGSSVTLGGDTTINVRFTASGRMLTLSRGEGMFRVYHETNRPFTVCAAGGCTTAVGTIFDVRLYSNHVRVWVKEGAVDIAPLVPTAINNGSAPNPRWMRVHLAHGQEVTYDPKIGASSPRAADLRDLAAWTNGTLIYFGRPLGEILEDVQRYSPRRIVLDPASSGLLYSGSVVQQHIDQWIRGLAQVFPVEITDCQVLQESTGSETNEVRSMCMSGPDRILIRPRRPAG